MARPSINDDIRREVGDVRADIAETRGKLDVLIEMLTDERRSASESRRVVYDKLEKVDARVARIEATVDPLVKDVAGHAEDIGQLQAFRAHIGAVVVIAGLAVTAILSGIGWLITTSWAEIVAFGRRLVP